MTKKLEREQVKAEHLYNGAGYIIKDVLVPKELLGGHCSMFAQVTIPSGCEIGVHQHVGDTETYHIIQGTGIYTDDNKTYRVEAGDVTFCAEGHCHGLINDGEEDLIMDAIILLAE